MPAPHPPEFRRRAVDLANLVDKDGKRVHSIADLAKDLGVLLRRWMDQDQVDTGKREGLTTKERAELVELRRKTRTLEIHSTAGTRARTIRTRESLDEGCVMSAGRPQLLPPILRRRW